MCFHCLSHVVFADKTTAIQQSVRKSAAIEAGGVTTTGAIAVLYQLLKVGSCRRWGSNSCGNSCTLPVAESWQLSEMGKYVKTAGTTAALYLLLKDCSCRRRGSNKAGATSVLYLLLKVGSCRRRGSGSSWSSEHIQSEINTYNLHNKITRSKRS